MNRCVACGEVIPEGSMVCKACMESPVDSFLSKNDIRIESMEEFAEALKDRIRNEVMNRFKASNIDGTYRLGAEICQLDIEIEIAKLLREFKNKEKDNGKTTRKNFR